VFAVGSFFKRAYKQNKGNAPRLMGDP